MTARRRKLGILLSTPPEHAGFRHGVRLAGAALARDVEVYVYCVDDATLGLADAELQTLRARGLTLYACAYGARRRRILLADQAVWSGLGTLTDLVRGADRFVSFN